MAILAIVVAILLLILLVGWFKANPFLGFLAAAIVAALISGIAPEKIPGLLETGIGSMLGSLAIILCVGAMFGKLISETGAAQQISRTLIHAFGEKRITWALMLTGFIVGIPLYYNVGFVLLVPLVFSVMHQTRLPAVYLGIPLLAGLSTTHGFLPPHPSPVALIQPFHADIGVTLFYGIIIAIPTVIVAGPLLATQLKNIHSKPIETFIAKPKSDAELPSPFNSFFCALLPVLLIATASFLPLVLPALKNNSWFNFISNPSIVLLIGLLVATWSLGIARGMAFEKLMNFFTEGLRDISTIVLIIAGAGALKQVFVASGVSNDLGYLLQKIPLNPLLMAWLIATVIRIALGSATVAGLTAAGIVAPLVVSSGANPNLMVLAVGAGSLMCSHVNDSGFWMYKEYFNLSLKDTFKSWSLMETVIGVMGIIGVLILDAII